MLAVTFGTLQIHIRHKLHADMDNALTLALLATAAGRVEGEESRLVPALLRQRLRGEKFADVVVRLDVNGRIGS